jgi:hypothetical protein
MSNQPSLWWSYDTENQSFGALPAGPFLLPAVFIAVFVGLASSLKDRANHPERVLPQSIASSAEYQQNKRRYYELIQKKVWQDGLTIAEQHELDQLKRPWWVESGTWSY